uniref:Uncharacterized protein n=1 Tax=Rhizophora mucronata TaxID=61149 RepID=A0A2P2K8F5_RHIMU
MCSAVLDFVNYQSITMSFNLSVLSAPCHGHGVKKLRHGVFKDQTRHYLCGSLSWAIVLALSLILQTHYICPSQVSGSDSASLTIAIKVVTILTWITLRLTN